MPFTKIRKVLGGAVWRKSQEFGSEDFKFQTENCSLYLVIWRIGRGKMEISNVTAFFFFLRSFVVKENREMQQ